MIIGLGSDLCNIERIQNSLERFGERFENRVFTEVERAKARRAEDLLVDEALLRWTPPAERPLMI